MQQHSKETLDSVLAICQKATLLACNRSVQLCNPFFPANTSENIDFTEQIRTLETQIGTVDQVEKLKKIHLILSRLEELCIHFKHENKQV
jgi:hypothetical protein